MSVLLTPNAPGGDTGYTCPQYPGLEIKTVISNGLDDDGNPIEGAEGIYEWGEVDLVRQPLAETEWERGYTATIAPITPRTLSKAISIVSGEGVIPTYVSLSNGEETIRSFTENQYPVATQGLDSTIGRIRVLSRFPANEPANWVSDSRAARLYESEADMRAFNPWQPEDGEEVGIKGSRNTFRWEAETSNFRPLISEEVQFTLASFDHLGVEDASQVIRLNNGHLVSLGDILSAKYIAGYRESNVAPVGNRQFAWDDALNTAANMQSVSWQWYGIYLDQDPSAEGIQAFHIHRNIITSTTTLYWSLSGWRGYNPSTQTPDQAAAQIRSGTYWFENTSPAASFTSLAISDPTGSRTSIYEISALAREYPRQISIDGRIPVAGQQVELSPVLLRELGINPTQTKWTVVNNDGVQGWELALSYATHYDDIEGKPDIPSSLEELLFLNDESNLDPPPATAQNALDAAIALARRDRGVYFVYSDRAERIGQIGHAVTQEDIDNRRIFEQLDDGTLWRATGTLDAIVWRNIGGAIQEEKFTEAPTTGIVLGARVWTTGTENSFQTLTPTMIERLMGWTTFVWNDENTACTLSSPRVQGDPSLTEIRFLGPDGSSKNTSYLKKSELVTYTLITRQGVPYLWEKRGPSFEDEERFTDVATTGIPIGAQVWTTASTHAFVNLTPDSKRESMGLTTYVWNDELAPCTLTAPTVSDGTAIGFMSPNGETSTESILERGELVTYTLIERDDRCYLWERRGVAGVRWNIIQAAVDRGITVEGGSLRPQVIYLNGNSINGNDYATVYDATNSVHGERLEAVALNRKQTLLIQGFDEFTDRGERSDGVVEIEAGERISLDVVVGGDGKTATILRSSQATVSLGAPRFSALSEAALLSGSTNRVQSDVILTSLAHLVQGVELASGNGDQLHVYSLGEANSTAVGVKIACRIPHLSFFVEIDADPGVQWVYSIFATGAHTTVVEARGMTVKVEVETRDEERVITAIAHATTYFGVAPKLTIKAVEPSTDVDAAAIYALELIKNITPAQEVVSSLSDGEAVILQYQSAGDRLIGSNLRLDPTITRNGVVSQNIEWDPDIDGFVFRVLGAEFWIRHKTSDYTPLSGNISYHVPNTGWGAVNRQGRFNTKWSRLWTGNLNMSAAESSQEFAFTATLTGRRYLFKGVIKPNYIDNLFEFTRFGEFINAD